ncbi:CaiB/BaiF CoA transferase family protein [Brevibacillus sp. B_LB10_24]|uniref:CaiB/BaiF CoA transferase family protein n=1 Tax=Brevibacillus sp. B_LB10_24 TaxID=3380645 RepID=UPI0038BB6BCA
MGFQPLIGLRVLDWTEGVAGPYACQILGDLGADVIKVERPAGDWGRALGTQINEMGTQYIALNRNKRNICLDVRKLDGLQIAKPLIKSADIMITSFRPGAMERLGLGYEQVREYHPQIIYGRVSGYGYEGALAQLPGVDTVVQAVSGFMSQIGESERVPFRVGFPILDHGAARDLLVGIMAALVAKMKGEEILQPIDVDLMSTSAALQAQQWQEFLMTGKEPMRSGNRNPSLAPAGVYETNDGKHLSLAVLREEHWQKFCSALGLEGLVSDPEFCTNALRVSNREKLESIIEPLIKSRTAGEWLRLFRQHDLLVAPVNTVGQVYEHKELFDTVPKVSVPVGDSGGQTISIGVPVKFGKPVDTRARYGAAAKGEHTRQILRELGMDEAAIEKSIASGAVTSHVAS